MTQPTTPSMISVLRDNHCVGFLRSATPKGFHCLQHRGDADWHVSGQSRCGRGDYGGEHLNSTGEPQMETLLKKREPFRDSMGRFDRHGKTLSKTAKNKFDKQSKNQPTEIGKRGGYRPGAGRPQGSQNKITKTLKEMILASLDRVGGELYLERLAIENSSAYCSLLGKILPTTLSTPEADGGVGVKMVFERHIVWPDGRVEIEGVTPKALPAPDGG
jgi:hypothetical protein